MCVVLFFCGSYCKLPRTMGLMYVHAFQSFVWNHMLSIRMEQFGPVPVPGDFVYAGNETTTTTSNDKDETVEEEMMPEEETVEEVFQGCFLS